jgi:hypothetical protein
MTISSSDPRKPSRFWEAVQPQIVRLYKIAGLVALTAILVGLIGFLVVNIFYFFNHTWVRPIELKSTSPKVVEASTQLNDARLRASQLATEQTEIAAQLDEIERTIAIDKQFLADVGTTMDAPKTPEQWIARREVEKVRLDKDHQEGRKTPLKSRQAGLGLRMQEQDLLVHSLEQSPYLRAAKHSVVLAFVPYDNLKNVSLGAKLYGCSWGLVMCSRVGKVVSTIEGEVQDTNPHDDGVMRGEMIEIELTTPSAAQNKVLFLGGKPLWLF